ncbi:N-formylglutamate amidohydrolase [Amorphus sp. 3PC139-8]|uniref:N-formylglutamate amidohydrolase n=1 Tax=Amorphus sp. 3PC139-8 TaxID=2735676 RepID=UPI00345CF6C7
MSARSREVGPVRLAEDEIRKLAAAAGDVLEPGSASPYLLIAEHAGNQVPEPWQDLGLAPGLLATHYGLDIGIDAATRCLSGKLAAPAVIARYSRLFLDFNRPSDEWDVLRPDLGGIPVPANLAADADERALREEIARAPLDRMIKTCAAGRHAMVSIHSFTPVMNGHRRDVDIGVLWCEPSPFIEAVFKRLRPAAEACGLKVGDNEPYDWRRENGYTLDRHGLDRGIAAVYLEIRNDLLSDPEVANTICDLLARALTEVAEQLWPDAVRAMLDRPTPSI